MERVCSLLWLGSDRCPCSNSRPSFRFREGFHSLERLRASWIEHWLPIWYSGEAAVSAAAAEAAVQRCCRVAKWGTRHVADRRPEVRVREDVEEVGSGWKQKGS